MDASSSGSEVPFLPGDKVRWIGPIGPKTKRKLIESSHVVAECWMEKLGLGEVWARLRLVDFMNDRRSVKDGAFLARHFKLIERNGVLIDSDEDLFADLKPIAVKQNQIVVISGGVWHPEQPRLEAGPDCYVSTLLKDGYSITPYWLCRFAIEQIATRPEHRPFIQGSRIEAMLILADEELTESDRHNAVVAASLMVGTVTESKQLVNKILWICLPSWANAQQVSRVAVNELKLIRSKRPSLKDSSIMFLLWASRPNAFSGDLNQVGRIICDEAFTFG